MIYKTQIKSLISKPISAECEVKSDLDVGIMVEVSFDV